MPSDTRISKLAELIQSNTEKLDKYLNEKGLKTPTFEIDAPEKLQLPADLEQVRQVILDATDELHRLILGPKQYLTGFSVSDSPSPLVSIY
jgi:hypothetical protein